MRDELLHLRIVGLLLLCEKLVRPVLNILILPHLHRLRHRHAILIDLLAIFVQHGHIHGDLLVTLIKTRRTIMRSITPVEDIIIREEFIGSNVFLIIFISTLTIGINGNRMVVSRIAYKVHRVRPGHGIIIEIPSLLHEQYIKVIRELLGVRRERFIEVRLRRGEFRIRHDAVLDVFLLVHLLIGGDEAALAIGNRIAVRAEHVGPVDDDRAAIGAGRGEAARLCAQVFVPDVALEGGRFLRLLRLGQLPGDVGPDAVDDGIHQHRLVQGQHADDVCIVLQIHRSAQAQAMDGVHVHLDSGIQVDNLRLRRLREGHRAHKRQGQNQCKCSLHILHPLFYGLYPHFNIFFR